MTRQSLGDRFWSKVQVAGPSDCWEWKAYRNKAGYGVFGWTNKTTLAHRTAWGLEFGEIPEGMCVCHTCDNPACCNPSHLFLGTHRDNMGDCQKKGRHSWSANKPATRVSPTQGNFKLNEWQVVGAMSRWLMGHSGAQISRDLGVVPECVYAICNGVRWAHLFEEAE